MGARNGRNRLAGETRDLPRIRAFYDGNAHSYDRWLAAYERAMGIGAHRDRLLSMASGRVLEVGVGTGRTLAAYPAEAQITGVDLSPAMLLIAKARASDLGRVVDLRTGDTQDLEFPEASFDAVVAMLVLSAVPDQHQAISEIKRVLRPEGRLLILDHARSTIRTVRSMQRAVDPLLARYARWHFSRDPLDDVRSAGFEIKEHHRSRFGMLAEVVARR
jgi:ubiquinone/menaquinone biosynthesis C-methylase UbiE